MVRRASCGRIRIWVATAGGAAAAFLIGCLYRPTVVVGHSMEPTLLPGQVVWTDRSYYLWHPPRRGDVVVFCHQGEATVKRVYAGPGETVYYVCCDSEPLLFISAKDVPTARKRLRRGMVLRSRRLRRDSVFVLGDNVNTSEDSRHFGPVPVRSLLGRVRLPRDPGRLRAHEYSPPPLIRHSTRRPRAVASR